MKNINFIKGSLAIIEGRLAQTRANSLDYLDPSQLASLDYLDLSQLAQGDRKNIPPFKSLPDVLKEDSEIAKKLLKMEKLAAQKGKYQNFAKIILVLNEFLNREFALLETPIKIVFDYEHKGRKITNATFRVEAPNRSFSSFIYLFPVNYDNGYAMVYPHSTVLPERYTIKFITDVERWSRKYVSPDAVLFSWSDIGKIYDIVKKLYQILSIDIDKHAY